MAAVPAQPSVRRRPAVTTLALAAACVVLGSFAAVLVARSSDDTAVQPAQVSSTAGRRTVERQPVVEVRRQPAPAVASIDASRVALASYKRGDIGGAVERFREAVEANPDDATALNNLGQLLVRTGRAAEAIPYFDRAVAIADTTWAFHFNRARAYGELQQWPRAVSGYRDAVRLFPEDYATHFNLAKALQATADLPGAIEAFERAIALAPGQADFHLSHGLALEAAKRPREAAAAYRRFLELEPDSAEAEKVKVRIAQLEGASKP